MIVKAGVAGVEEILKWEEFVEKLGLRLAPFDRPYTTFYWSDSTNIA